MTTYSYYEISSIGGSIDNYNVDAEAYLNILVYNENPVTLSNTFSIAPTIPTDTVGFSVRWQANVDLNGYAMSICGVNINQSLVNKPGVFECYYNTELSPAGWQVQFYADDIEQPQQNQGVETITVPSSGSLTLDAGVLKSYIRLLGSPTTLVGSYTVDGNIGATDGSQIWVEIAGNVTLNGESFTVFNQSIPSDMALNGGGLVIATYDDTNDVWQSILVNKNITLDSIDPIAGLSVLVNDTSSIGAVTALAFPTDGHVLKRSGTSLVTGLVTAANFDESAMIPQVSYTFVSNAQLLDAFSTPVQVLTAPAAGFLNWIHGVIITTSTDASPFVAYDTNTNLEFYFTGASDPIISVGGVLGFTSNLIKYLYPSNVSGANANVVSSQALNLQVPTGNPLNGTSTILVGVIYSVAPPISNPLP
jgi:hypothetical protein